jgi:hypothetical protein
VYDANENIVAISNTAVVENPKKYSPANRSSMPKSNIAPVTSKGNLWQIYPNPVGELLNLAYRGKDIIKGVINIVIQDAAGKAVVKFRASSRNKQLRIPVSNLHAGFYFIKINVINEIQMNEKFIKR